MLVCTVCYEKEYRHDERKKKSQTNIWYDGEILKAKSNEKRGK
jgi:hypothetical protein